MLEPTMYPVLRDSELDELVTATYGQPHCYQQRFMFSNDSLHQIEAQPSSAWPVNEEWWQEEVRKFKEWQDEVPPDKDSHEYGVWQMRKEREPGFYDAVMWADLVDRGLLAPGDHYVYVWW